MVTYGGEQSLDRFLAISARGVPFNVAHAAGNAALALVAGPVMVRMLLRYRRRFEFAWERRGSTATAGGAAAGAACLIAALLLAGAALPGERAVAAGGVDAGVGLAARSPERRWWLRLRPGAGLQPGDERMGGRRPRGRRDQPARPRSWRRHPRLTTWPGQSERSARPATSSGRSWCCGERDSIRGDSRATTWSVGSSPGEGRTAPGVVRSIPRRSGSSR